MATLKRLIKEEKLQQIEVQLRGRSLPNRRIYGTTGFLGWLKDELPTLAPRTPWGRASVLEQVRNLLETYISGGHLNYGPLNNELSFHSMLPPENGVVELKTADLRIYGWFHAKDCYVAHRGLLKEFVSDHHLDAGLRDEVARYRDVELNMTYVVGDDEHDFISI